MLLLNNLYTIVAKDIGCNHFIYQAHFPNEPITPGVCIIQITKELLDDFLTKKMDINQIKNVKFLSVISPITTPQLSCIFDKITPDEHSDTFRVQAHLQSDDNPLAKLSFTCKCHDGKQ